MSPSCQDSSYQTTYLTPLHLNISSEHIPLLPILTPDSRYLNIYQYNLTMFLQFCLIGLILAIPCLAIVYRLIKNKFFGTVFNLHMAALFILTGNKARAKKDYLIIDYLIILYLALQVPISTVMNLTLATGSEDFRHLSCFLKPIIGWTWQGSMAISAFYALLFK